MPPFIMSVALVAVALKTRSPTVYCTSPFSITLTPVLAVCTNRRELLMAPLPSRVKVTLSAINLNNGFTSPVTVTPSGTVIVVSDAISIVSVTVMVSPEVALPSAVVRSSAVVTLASAAFTDTASTSTNSITNSATTRILPSLFVFIVFSSSN